MEPADRDAVVRFDRVSKTFPNGTQALSAVDIDVRAGEFVAFLGPSGCGKSTVFRLATGLTEPSAGSATIVGRPPHEARRAGGVSFVFQDASLLPWSSVAANVALPLTLRRTPKKTVREEVSRVLELVGLTGHERDLPRELSGGMRMRVSIARALISRPRLLLMDEPFAALDEMTRQSLQEEVLDLWRRTPQTTVLFITHNIFEAGYLATRVLVMSPRPGRIVDDIAVERAGLPTGHLLRSSRGFTEIVGRLDAALHQAPAGKAS